MYNAVEPKTEDEYRKLFNLAADGETVEVSRPGVVLLSQEDYKKLKRNAAAAAIAQAQLAFAGVAEELGIKNDEDVQKLVDEIRYGAGR